MGDAQGVVVAAALGLLQDVLRVVHGDDAAVGDEVGQHQPPVVVHPGARLLCKGNIEAGKKRKIQKEIS